MGSTYYKNLVCIYILNEQFLHAEGNISFSLCQLVLTGTLTDGFYHPYFS